ncbi:hypothetical protein LCGC14_3145760 [marine sediment metagenome]|uniref:Uncharacterized protein n=1 Tax=marine sediment metagenome TaxID=412755 RepID=A0A0F8Y2G6_9ZZZZ
MAIDNIRFTAPVAGTTSSNPSIVEGSVQVGGQSTLLIADMTSRDLLEGIYMELKKLNLRQQEAFEETVNDEDIQCE